MCKIIALFTVCSLALLGGCGAGVGATPGIMEPLQGGEMLYTFPDDSGDEWGAYGIINQNGEVIAEPQYFHYPRYVTYSQYDPQYVYDKGKERIIGLLAKQDVNEKGQGIYTYYTLDGKAKQLNCGAAYEINVAPGGRYAVVIETYSEERNGSNWTVISEHGLFDIENNAWAVKPKEGQYIGRLDDMYMFSDAAIGRTWKEGKLVEAWYFDFETGEQHSLPTALVESANHMEYIPDVKWFLFMIDGTFRWYNEEFQHMPQLDNWRAYGNQEFYGKYALISKEGSPHYTAWVDRGGNIIHEKRYCHLSETSQMPYCYPVIEWSQIEKEILHNNDDNLVSIRDERAYILLNPDLNPVFTGEPGDLIRVFDTPFSGYMLLDKQGRAKDVCDAYGNPLPVSDTPYILHGWYTPWVKLQDGMLIELPDLSDYGYNKYYYFDGCEGDFIDARAVVAYEDFILVSGWQGLAAEKQDEYVNPILFAVDWDGNLYPDCPLEPFLGSAHTELDDFFKHSFSWPTAGEQGPNYYWVEKGRKRGYIDTHGNWLFIDKS